MGAASLLIAQGARAIRKGRIAQGNAHRGRKLGRAAATTTELGVEWPSASELSLQLPLARALGLVGVAIRQS